MAAAKEQQLGIARNEIVKCTLAHKVNTFVPVTIFLSSFIYRL